MENRSPKKANVFEACNLTFFLAWKTILEGAPIDLSVHNILKTLSISAWNPTHLPHNEL